MIQIDKSKLYGLVKAQSRVFDKSQNVAQDQTFDYHIGVVIKNAVRLAKLYGGDAELCEIAALFHDYANLVDYKKYSATHHIASGEMAEPILLSAGYSKDFVEKVKKCIFAHRNKFLC
jgi:HD superfamily phosphodiesterase